MEPLTQALYEGSETTRLAAASALNMIGGPRSVEPLAYAAKHDTDKDVRIVAVESLGEIGGSEAKRVLKLALKDELPEVRSQAARALSLLRDTSAVDPLLRALRDKDGAVRFYAAEDLGYVGGRNKVAERMIRAALENVEKDIQPEATYALEKMEEEKWLETFDTETSEA